MDMNIQSEVSRYCYRVLCVWPSECVYVFVCRSLSNNHISVIEADSWTACTQLTHLYVRLPVCLSVCLHLIYLFCCDWMRRVVWTGTGVCLLYAFSNVFSVYVGYWWKHRADIYWFLDSNEMSWFDHPQYISNSQIIVHFCSKQLYDNEN